MISPTKNKQTERAKRGPCNTSIQSTIILNPPPSPRDALRRHMRKRKRDVGLLTYERDSFNARANMTLIATLALPVNETHQSLLATESSFVDDSVLVDIWSALIVTPENSAAAVRMLIKFCEERCCPRLITDTPSKRINAGESTMMISVDLPTAVNSLIAVETFSKSLSSSFVNWWT